LLIELWGLGEFTKIAAQHLLNQFGSEILLRFPFVLGRREAGFHCPEIWHSPINC
jgi:hypothetical protein